MFTLWSSLPFVPLQSKDAVYVTARSGVRRTRRACRPSAGLFDPHTGRDVPACEGGRPKDPAMRRHRIQSKRPGSRALLGVASRQDRCLAERRVFLLPRPSRSSLWRLARDRVSRKATHRRASPHARSHVSTTRGATGAVNRPAFRMPFGARKAKEDRRALEPDKPQGDDACLEVRPSP